VLRENLAKLGWIEGRNLQIDVRWGAGDLDRLEHHAIESVSLMPEVIVTNAGAATRAAQRATQTIPIVYMAGGDPVITGLVRNIARPEGNTTGFSGVHPSFAGKWLELLKEAAPHLTHVAVLYNPDLLSGGMFSAYIGVLAKAHEALAVRMTETPVRDPIETVRTIDAFATEPNGGMIVLPTTINVPTNRDIIISLAMQHRLPTIYPSRDLAVAGGFMSYAPNLADQLRGGASYIDRLLRGAKVNELPVQFPTKFELVINLETAKALGLDVPPSIRLRADEVIE
jgi:putative ABC transport system substrate-binding protein